MELASSLSLGLDHQALTTLSIKGFSWGKGSFPQVEEFRYLGFLFLSDGWTESTDRGLILNEGVALVILGEERIKLKGKYLDLLDLQTC